MNLPDYINVPKDYLTYNYVLNRQPHNEYLLNNLTRCAVIFNYINTPNVLFNSSVDEIFYKFCCIKDPSTIPKIFLKNFETFIHIYLLERFGKMYDIFISEGEIQDMVFPIHAFCSGRSVIVLYSKKDLKFLVDTQSLYQYLYFNDKHFLIPRNVDPSTEQPKTSKKNFFVDKNKNIFMQKTKLESVIDEIQKSGQFNYQSNTTYIQKLNSYCNKLNSNPDLPVINEKNFNYGSLAAFGNTITKPNTKVSLTPNEQQNVPFNNRIQSNFADIWTSDNQVALTYLIIVTQILEIAIRPILCSITTNTIEHNIVDNKNLPSTLYKDFLSSFTHSINIDLHSTKHKHENQASDFKYNNLRQDT